MKTRPRVFVTLFSLSLPLLSPFFHSPVRWEDGERFGWDRVWVEVNCWLLVPAPCLLLNWYLLLKPLWIQRVSECVYNCNKSLMKFHQDLGWFEWNSTKIWYELGWFEWNSTKIWYDLIEPVSDTFKVRLESWSLSNQCWMANVTPNNNRKEWLNGTWKWGWRVNLKQIGSQQIGSQQMDVVIVLKSSHSTCLHWLLLASFSWNVIQIVVDAFRSIRSWEWSNILSSPSDDLICMKINIPVSIFVMNWEWNNLYGN